MEQKDELMGIPQLIHFNAMLITGALFLAIVLMKYIGQSNSMLVVSVILLLSLGLLITSADFFIEGAKGLARRAGIAEIVIGLTIVSIGTSLPEILVSGSAAYEASQGKAGAADFAIGSILGSVLVQITLILGIVVMTRSVKVRPSWLNRDGVIMLLAVVLLLFFVWTNNTLERWEGAILASLYIAYIVWLLMKREAIRQEEVEDAGDYEIRGSNWSSAAYMLMIFVGLAFAVYAANILVEQAYDLAVKLHVPHSVIGTTVSGITTKGKVSFISKQADRVTKTFRVEILADNNDELIRDGETIQIQINLESNNAHLLPQSVLTLNDEGDLGVRTVVNKTVQFFKVKILRDQKNGLLLTGLPDNVDVITVGQECVVDGQKVNISYE